MKPEYRQKLKLIQYEIFPPYRKHHTMATQEDALTKSLEKLIVDYISDNIFKIHELFSLGKKTLIEADIAYCMETLYKRDPMSFPLRYKELIIKWNDLYQINVLYGLTKRDITFSKYETENISNGD